MIGCEHLKYLIGVFRFFLIFVFTEIYLKNTKMQRGVLYSGEARAN